LSTPSPRTTGALAARRHGAAELVDPRPFAAGSLKSVFEAYPHLTQVLLAEGYFPEIEDWGEPSLDRVIEEFLRRQTLPTLPSR